MPAGQILELAGAVNEVLFLQGLLMAAAREGKPHLLHGAPLELGGDLVGIAGRAPADDLGILRALAAFFRQGNGGPLPFDVGVLVQLIEQEERDGFVSPASFRVGTQHVNGGGAEEVGQIVHRIRLFADLIQQLVFFDPLLEPRPRNFPGLLHRVDRIGDVSRPVHNHPTDDDQDPHRQTHLRTLPDPELALAGTLHPFQQLPHIGGGGRTPQHAPHFLILGGGNPHRPLRPFVNLLIWLRLVNPGHHAHDPRPQRCIIVFHRKTSSWNRVNNRSHSLFHASSITGDTGSPRITAIPRNSSRTSRSIGW